MIALLQACSIGHLHLWRASHSYMCPELKAHLTRSNLTCLVYFNIDYINPGLACLGAGICMTMWALP